METGIWPKNKAATRIIERQENQTNTSRVIYRQQRPEITGDTAIPLLHVRKVNAIIRIGIWILRVGHGYE
jgi:hypothetical protein